MLVQQVAKSDYDINFADVEALRDENYFPALARMREAEAVYWSDFQRGWMITRHAEVAQAFQDERFSAVRLHINQLKAIPADEHASVIPTISKYVPKWIINIDGADHDRIRSLVVKAFSKKVIEKLRPQIQEIIDGLVEKARQQKECEFIGEIAYPLPATVILNMLGVSLDYLPKVRVWARDIVMAFASASPSRETILAGESALTELTDLVRVEIEKRRRQPQEDFLTALLQATEGDDRLSMDEMLGLCHVLFTAGHDTTVNSLGMGLIAWLDHPRQRDKFLENPANAMQAISEMLRYISMSSCQIRFAREDFEFGGKSIRAGDVCYLMISAANRDPRVFDDPEAFDIERSNTDQSLTFGPGFHHCLGHLLGRVELTMFFQTFLREFPDMKVVDEQPQVTPNYAFRGLEGLRVRFE